MALLVDGPTLSPGNLEIIPFKVREIPIDDIPTRLPKNEDINPRPLEIGSAESLKELVYKESHFDLLAKQIDFRKEQAVAFCWRGKSDQEILVHYQKDNDIVFIHDRGHSVGQAYARRLFVFDKRATVKFRSLADR